MCRCTYDVETGKVYEMYLEDMDYLLNYKYGRLNYVEFGNKYYAREDPSETIHVRTKLNIFSRRRVGHSEKGLSHGGWLAHSCQKVQGLKI